METRTDSCGQLAEKRSRGLDEFLRPKQNGGLQGCHMCGGKQIAQIQMALAPLLGEPAAAPESNEGSTIQAAPNPLAHRSFGKRQTGVLPSPLQHPYVPRISRHSPFSSKGRPDRGRAPYIQSGNHHARKLQVATRGCSGSPLFTLFAQGQPAKRWLRHDPLSTCHCVDSRHDENAEGTKPRMVPQSTF